MAIPAINVLGNPNVTEGNFQIAIEDLRKSVIGSGKAYDSSNTYSQYDTCVSGGIVYYSKINSNTGNTPTVGVNWGLIGDLITGVVHNVGNETVAGNKSFTGNLLMTGASSVVGYGTGSGITVVQPSTSGKSTAVTVNKSNGIITMNGATLAAGASVLFPFYNSIVNYETDQIFLNIHSVVSGHSNYRVENAGARGEDSIYIKLTNTSGVSLSETPSIKFTVIKGAVS